MKTKVRNTRKRRNNSIFKSTHKRVWNDSKQKYVLVSKKVQRNEEEIAPIGRGHHKRDRYYTNFIGKTIRANRRHATGVR